MDLNLLTAFAALMQDRSVTLAARRLGIGQPALSHALGRLRHAIGDPLFVRQGRVMEPTKRAHALLDDIAPSMQQLEMAVRTKSAFDPQTSEPVFRVGMSDDIMLAFLPRITDEVYARIPGASLIVLNADYIRAAEMLDRGAVTTAIGYLEKLPASAKVKRLRTTHYRILGSPQRAGRLTLKSYCQQRHVIVTFAGDLKGYIDETLGELGVARRIVLSLPQFAGLPQVLQSSDLVVTVPDFVADTLAASNDLYSGPLPFPSPTCNLSMAWRSAVETDPAERLLRDIIAGVIRSRPAARAARGSRVAVAPAKLD